MAARSGEAPKDGLKDGTEAPRPGTGGKADGKVVSLAGRGHRADAGGAGQKAAGQGADETPPQTTPESQPAPDGPVAALLNRLVVDESLPLYLADADGTLLHVNGHYHTLMERLDGPTLAPGPGEAGVGYSVPQLAGTLADVVALGETLRQRESITLASGETRTWLGRHMPVRGTGGQIIAVAGTYEDVTSHIRAVEDARKLQARHQDFARATSDWFFEVDAELKITSLSERFTALVGQPAPLFIGTHLMDLGLPGKNLSGRSDMDAAISRRKPFRDQLVHIRDDSGDRQRFHLSAVPVFGPRGTFWGYRGVGMAVEDRYRQAEERDDARREMEGLLKELTRKNHALDQAHGELSAALKARTEFLAAMSHELRTPLNAVIGFSDGLKDARHGPLSETYQQHGAEIARAGRHLLSLINDVLDATSLESGGLALSATPLNAAALLAETASMMADRAEARGLSLTVANSDAPLVGDRRRVSQILINLVGNAVKFTQHGHVTLSAKTDGTRTHLHVTDTGPGIPADRLEHIFDKFSQIRGEGEAYARGQEGTGLGLHISRQLAEAMGGTLTATSKEGNGSTFTLTLPATEDGTEKTNESDHCGDFI
ncbi:PAS domain-containing sensor histidine kinase [Yunchengibacter salinarum]|uniref:PAS domain-containing sensor histidine kinase n=1 Tax=Yunchengibacter salinarum TaxID=3133399 RepID=UPI0035B59032